MNFLDAFILGMIQGITEWLPISSSGQGMLVMVNLFGIDALRALGLSFFLHIGSLFAVIVYFKKEIWGMLSGVSGENGVSMGGRPYLKFLVVASAASAVSGGLSYKVLRSMFSSAGDGINILIGVSLILTGIFLKSQKRSGEKTVKDGGILDMMIIGAVQGIAIIPGISRSGITIAALLFRKFTPEESLKISFLMAVPAIAGANLLTFTQGETGFFPSDILIVGILSSLLFSILGIGFLLRVSKKLDFSNFCIFIGAIATLFGVYLLL